MQRQNSRGCSSAKCADRQPAHGCRSDVLLHQGAGSGDPSREQRQLHGDIRSETQLTVEVARVRMEYLADLIERTGNRGIIAEPQTARVAQEYFCRRLLLVVALIVHSGFSSSHVKLLTSGAKHLRRFHRACVAASSMRAATSFGLEV